MSQHLYNKVILEKIAQEESKSNGLLTAGGVGLAGAGIGSVVGNRKGTAAGNELIKKVRQAGRANVANVVSGNKAAVGKFQKELSSAQVASDAAGLAYNKGRDALYNAQKDFELLHGQHAAGPNAKMRNWMVDQASERYMGAKNELGRLNAHADDKLSDLKRAQSNLTSGQKWSDYLNAKARGEALENFRGARSQRTSMIRKATGRGAAIGGGLALGAYGAKKLYDNYNEKKASYEYATLEKIAKADSETPNTAGVLASGALVGGTAGGLNNYLKFKGDRNFADRMLLRSHGELSEAKKRAEIAAEANRNKSKSMEALRKQYEPLKQEMNDIFNRARTPGQKLDTDALNKIYKQQDILERQYTNLNSGILRQNAENAAKRLGEQEVLHSGIERTAKGIKHVANKNMLKAVGKGAAIGGVLAYGAKKLHDKYSSK